MLTKAYGLITVLPSQPGSEAGAQTVIFSGITSAGPQAALEFFRSPGGLCGAAGETTKRRLCEIPPSLPGSGPLRDQP